MIGKDWINKDWNKKDWIKEVNNILERKGLQNVGQKMIG